MTRTLRSADDLIAAGLAPAAQRAALESVGRRYAIAVSNSVKQLINRSDPADPIARQFLPSLNELELRPEERADPIGDAAHSPLEGVVHRYPDRVLLKIVSVCPVYCRFCFRRETVGVKGSGLLAPEALAKAIDYIRAHEKIWEVILTGGDPLALAARRLADVMAALADIPHVKIIRFHTRVPVVAPERVTPALVKALKAPGKTTYVALHANHPREFGPAARAAIARIADAGIPLVSQTVLLKGVNDNTVTLSELMRCFTENRVKPYHLNHADLAPGTAHFRTTIADGQALMRGLRGHISGLCQPHYVLDIPGGHGKAPIGPGYLSASQRQVSDYCGGVHDYPPGDAADGA